MKTQPRINKILKQTLKKQPRDIKGTSVNNCITSINKECVIYSFFDAFKSGNKIEVELVSIQISTLTEKVQVYRVQLDYESYFRINVKDIEELRFNIQTNPKNKSLHILEIKLISKDTKSKFFLFQCDYQTIVSKEPMFMIEIMAQKSILHIHWHPIQENIFLALTVEAFVLFECGQNYAQIDTISFKQLQIRGKLYDFCFWPNLGAEESYLIVAVGDSKNTHILVVCSGKIKTEKISNQQRLKMFLQFEPPCIERFQVLESSDLGNWQHVKLIKANYNSKEILLLLKTSYHYKDNKRQSIFEISSLSYDESGKYTERQIAKLSESVSDHTRECIFPLDKLWNSSLLYFYDEKINMLNLSKSLNHLTNAFSRQSKLYYTSEVQNELLLQIGNYDTKFILFTHNGITLLRRTHSAEDYDFGRIPGQQLELAIGERSITARINKLIKDIGLETSKIQTEDSSFGIDTIAPLSETASETQIERYVSSVQKYIKESDQYIKNQKASLNILKKNLEKESLKFKANSSKRDKIEALSKRIEENSKEIDQLLNNDSLERTVFEDKIDEIKSMVEFVISKPLELEESTKHQFAREVEVHLKKAAELEKIISQVENELDNKF